MQWSQYVGGIGKRRMRQVENNGERETRDERKRQTG